ncbi:hypothetical protein CCACVL1_05952, partial [Corchorus capsularis]
MKNKSKISSINSPTKIGSLLWKPPKSEIWPGSEVAPLPGIVKETPFLSAKLLMSTKESSHEYYCSDLYSS